MYRQVRPSESAVSFGKSIWNMRVRLSVGNSATRLSVGSIPNWACRTVGTPAHNRRDMAISMGVNRMLRSYGVPPVGRPNRSAILSARYAKSDSMLRRTQRPATRAPSRPIGKR